MTRGGTAALVITAVVLIPAGDRRLAAADASGLAGRWTLNRGLSQIPREVGFGMDIAAAAASTSGADDRMGGGGLSRMPLFRESADDAKRRDLLVEEVQTPSPHLTIVETDTAVTITNELGQARTFHPHGRSEYQILDQVSSVVTTSRWDGPRLDVRYMVEQNRELRYTYSRIADPPQLVVEVRLVERSGHQVVTLVYEPAKPNESVAPAPAASKAAPASPVAPPSATRPPGLDTPAAVPAPISPAMRPVGSIVPDAELKGLSALGVVVEGLGQEAAACGLSQAPLEALVAKSLGDAGFKTTRNPDEDSYVDVRVMTTATPAGLCISSYDVYLYTHTMATLPYQTGPVLVLVELVHTGGMTGGSARTHGEAVGRSVKQSVDEVASRIRAAGK